MRAFDLPRSPFALALLLALAACGGDGGTDPVVPDPDGDEEEDEEVTWDPAALTEIRIYMDTTRTSGFVLYLGDEIVAEGYYEEPNLSGAPEAVVTSWEASRRRPTQTGFPVEDLGELQTAVTGLLAMIAVEEGLLDPDASVSSYLGAGWSNASEADEAAITVAHLLRMTSGLDDGLGRAAAPGTRWSWNLPAFRVLHDVLPAATGLEMQVMSNLWLVDRMGLEVAEWLEREDGTLGFSTTPRDLASIGLAVMNGGIFQGDRIFETSTATALVSSSQALNPAWGLGWWKNGTDLRLRRDGTETEAWFYPTAPSDTFVALGDHDRYLIVIPSRRTVLVRFGPWIDVPGRASILDEFLAYVTLTAPR